MKTKQIKPQTIGVDKVRGRGLVINVNGKEVVFKSQLAKDVILPFIDELTGEAVEEKACKACKKVKKLTEFYNSVGYKKQAYCKSCQKDKNKKYYEENIKFGRNVSREK